MAQSCRICRHESRSAIEQAILNDKPASQIARTFGFTYTTRTTGKEVGDHKVITHHRDTCMPDAYQKAMADREVRSGNAMAARVEYLDDQVDVVIRRALKGEVLEVNGIPLLDDEGKPIYRYNDRLLLAAVREARGNVELLAKLAGAIPEGKSEELDAIRRRLESPEARRLLAQLDALDAQDDSQTSRSGD